MSIATIIKIVTFIMLFVAGGRIKHLFGIILPSLFTLAIFFIFSSDYRRERMLNFIDPWKDAADAGYQLIQSFLALGSGGLTGLGLGQSRQKTLYMPEPHNCIIFDIYMERSKSCYECKRYLW